ncbi:MAG: glycosyltransferase family 2 protein [Phycisphaerales bacterium]|jgi:chlorobactene glucosyltransferase|nr:glycosyltransferase family 2 protein [Phycisphaerales bacterium]
MITQVKYMLMAVVEVISLIFGIVVFGSLCLWLGVLYRLWMMHRTKPTIREGLSLPNPIESSVSIVVPAHNEERVIDKCATALRKQSHKNIQIIFVLDRCTDNTLEILQRHADEDVRVCIIENQHCPDDWAGKCNAAKLGSEKATGEWLIFTDADTQFDEELVRCAVASAIKREASLLSILSTLTISKAFERVAQPIASTFLVRQYPVDRVNRKRNPRPFANGQFLLFSREIYEQIGGHDAVKDDLLEDIAFANYIGHRNLGRVQLLFADGLLKCSMYPTYEAFKTGWKRIYIEASARNVSRLMRSALLAIIVGVILPAVSIAGIFIGIEWSTLLMWLSVSSLIACILTICWLYKINNAPMFFAVFAPIGSVIVAKLFIESALMLKSRTPICWGGREYILEPKQ